MKQFIQFVVIGSLLTGCATLERQRRPEVRPEQVEARIETRAQRPIAPPEVANTAEELDTTTAAQRAEARDATGGGALLGTTIASLGNVTEPGFWLETPLVNAVTQGRVVAADGTAVQVELRPIEGSDGAGSRISLAAMRLLGVALTDLPEVKVFSG